MPKRKKTASAPPICVNRYFLIEALKRSEKVMKQYKQGGVPRFILCSRYGLDEEALARKDHDKYLSVIPDAPSDSDYLKLGFVSHDPNILDLKIVAKVPKGGVKYTTGHFNFWQNGGEATVLEFLRDPTPEVLCLAIPMKASPTALIERLYPLIQARHKEAMNVPPDERTIRINNVTKCFFEDVAAWRRYIQCYDLWKSGHLSQKEIAYQIYPGTDRLCSEEVSKAVQNVKSGIKQVRQMIKSAEKGVWPPRR